MLGGISWCRVYGNIPGTYMCSVGYPAGDSSPRDVCSSRTLHWKSQAAPWTPLSHTVEGKTASPSCSGYPQNTFSGVWRQHMSEETGKQSRHIPFSSTPDDRATCTWLVELQNGFKRPRAAQTGEEQRSPLPLHTETSSKCHAKYLWRCLGSMQLLVRWIGYLGPFKTTTENLEPIAATVWLGPRGSYLLFHPL